jgi:putative flippase GtrA
VRPLETNGVGTGQGEARAQGRSGLARFFSRRVGRMLVRNTVVSTGAFALGLAVLWLLVQRFDVPEVPAAAVSFLVANTLHYVLGRAWIFRGTKRGVRSGYVIFLVNAAIGLAITVSTFAALLQFTDIHYLVARVIVSVFAGLAIFALNASLNFRQV